METILEAVQADYAALVEGTAPEELARHRQSVCCVERYDVSYIRNVPKAVVDADLGCGNPTKYLRPGDTVLDIGCGAGMNCYIAAQIVGQTGAVIGVDITPQMLAVARSSYPEFATAQPTAAPMRFVAAAANDMALDLEWSAAELAQKPLATLEDMRAYQATVARRRATDAAIADNSVDVVISNCVINLLDDLDKPAVFREIARVLRPGGRFAISDNVSNIPVPESVKNDRVLWSACYAGVLQEQAFYAQLEAAGLVDVRIEVRNPEPALTVEDLIFYSITVTGRKPETTEQTSRVMYRGPLKAVVGESGKIYRRGAIETLAAKDAHLAASLEANGFLPVDGAVATTEPASCCGPTTASTPAPAASCCG